jgi:hypothetical protein
MGLRIDKRIKRALGYYRLRAHLQRPGFGRSVRGTDTFLVGHPKSGNTWIAYLLAILLRRDHEGRVTVANVGDHVPVVHQRDAVIRLAPYSDLPDPRVFRNEIPLYPDLYPRVIYAVRDPRAVLVSLWHMYLARFAPASLPLDAFVDHYLERTGPFREWHRELPGWAAHVDAWTMRSENRADTLLVRYEDVVRDRRTWIERLAAFLDLEATEELIDLATRRGAFGAMQANEDRHGAESYLDVDPGDERFFREGRIDGWRDELSPETARRIETAYGPTMRRLGYLEASK